MIRIVVEVERGPALVDRFSLVERGPGNIPPVATDHIAVGIIAVGRQAGGTVPDFGHRVRSGRARAIGVTITKIGFIENITASVIAIGPDTHGGNGRAGQSIEAVIDKCLVQGLIVVLTLPEITQGIERVFQVLDVAARPRACADRLQAAVGGFIAAQRVQAVSQCF